MYAIVKTGGKQYKVAPGDKINIEKLDVEPGDKVELEAICVVDGDKVEADPAKAAKTKVVATVLEQFKGLQVQEAQELQEAARSSSEPDPREDRIRRYGQGRVNGLGGTSHGTQERLGLYP